MGYAVAIATPTTVGQVLEAVFVCSPYPDRSLLSSSVIRFEPKKKLCLQPRDRSAIARACMYICQCVCVLLCFRSAYLLLFSPPNSTHTHMFTHAQQIHTHTQSALGDVKGNGAMKHAGGSQGKFHFFRCTANLCEVVFVHHPVILESYSTHLRPHCQHTRS